VRDHLAAKRAAANPEPAEEKVAAKVEARPAEPADRRALASAKPILTLDGVTLAFGGVLMFLSDKLLGGQWRAGGGDVVLLVASSLFSYYTVAAKPIMERHGPVLTMGYATLWGGMPLLAVSIPLGWDSPWDQLQFWDWFGVVWAVEVSAFFGWLAWGWINTVRGVARTAPLMYLMPPMAGLFAWALSGEHYSSIKMAGAGVTLLGVALAQYAGRWRRRLKT